MCLFDENLYILQVNKKKIIPLKNGQKVRRGISQRSYPGGQFAYENFLNIINPKGSANENYTWITWLKC